MSKPSIAILGASGMLGSDITGLLRSRNLQVHCFDVPDFDITRSADLERVVSESDVIINCAAYTDVDNAESDSDVADVVNALAVGELGTCVAEKKKYVIHFSTDFVFDGSKTGCYTEDDVPNPVNYYGQTKLKGEQLLQHSGCSHSIIRLEWTYGSAGIHFITKILQRIREDGQISVVSDQEGAPTATVEIALAVYEFVMNRYEGVFLFAARDYTNRYEIARFIVEKFDLNARVTPCRTGDFPVPAARPLNSKFDCSKIDSILSFKREHWSKSLHKFLETIK